MTNKEAVFKAIQDAQRIVEDSKKISVNEEFLKNLKAVVEQFMYHLAVRGQVEPTFAEFIQFIKEAENDTE